MPSTMTTLDPPFKTDTTVDTVVHFEGITHEEYPAIFPRYALLQTVFIDDLILLIPIIL